MYHPMHCKRKPFFEQRVWFIFSDQAAAARQALQSMKLAQRPFSRQHLTASRALAPAFDQRGIRMAELRVLCLACHDAPCCSRPDARRAPFAGLRKPPLDRPMPNLDAPDCNPPKRRQSDRSRKRKTDFTQKYKPHPGSAMAIDLDPKCADAGELFLNGRLTGLAEFASHAAADHGGAMPPVCPAFWQRGSDCRSMMETPTAI